jgi:hypothetical protein
MTYESSRVRWRDRTKREEADVSAHVVAGSPIKFLKSGRLLQKMGNPCAFGFTW